MWGPRRDIRGDLLQDHGAQQGQRPKCASGGTGLLRPRRDRDPRDAVRSDAEPAHGERHDGDPDGERERDLAAVDVGDGHQVQRVAADVAAQRGAVPGAVPALGVLDAQSAVPDADVGERHLARVGREQVVQAAEDLGGRGVVVVAQRDEVEFTQPRRRRARQDEGGEDGGDCEHDQGEEEDGLWREC